MSFRLLGLDPEPFASFVGLSDEALHARGARRVIADAKPGFPDRIAVRDAEPGESVILLNFTHQPADTPYRASHAIFVLEHAAARCDLIDHVPEALRVRPLSLRAFDSGHEMIDADLIDGGDLAAAAELMLANPRIAYLHVHYAKRGCYAARIERA